MYIIESGKRFSESAIWDYQRRYYETRGITAWSRYSIPSYITSNPVIGKAYAQVAAGFLRDLLKNASTSKKLYILELGAGHGRHTFYFLKQFKRLAACICPGFEVCYIASDFVERNIEFLETHPKLRPFIENGMLDFALFDAEKDTHLRLRRSGEVISKGVLEQPLLVIANYFFDVLRQDLFFLRGGELHECIVTLSTEDENRECPSIESLNVEHLCRELSGAPFKEEYLCGLLNNYIQGKPDTYILFPACAIRCMETLRQFSENGLLLLTADKFYCENDFEHPFPMIIPHDNSFSLSVNNHIFHIYCENSGGAALSPHHNHISIRAECLLFLENTERYTETKLAYDESLSNYGPDEFCSIITSFQKQETQISFELWISIMRYCGYDSKVLLSIMPYLYSLLPEISDYSRNALLEILSNVWDMHYQIEEDIDIGLELGKILIISGMPREAAGYLESSVNCGNHSNEVIQNLLFCYTEVKDHLKGAELLLQLDGTSFRESC